MMGDAIAGSANAAVPHTPVHTASGVLVRPVQPAELSEVGELTVTAYRAGGPLAQASDDSYAVALRDAADRAEHGELLVAVDDAGALLGTVTIARAGTAYAELCGEGELEMRMLAVAPHARRRGVGEALTRAVAGRAREEAAARVILCSMQELRPAHRLYERIGFRRCPERDWTVNSETRLLAFALDL